MRLLRISFLALLACALLTGAVAQNQTQPVQSETPPQPVSPSQTQEWVPNGIAALGQNATSRTEFSLDHSMLVLASKLDKDDEDLRRVIAGVNGVSVHSFRFPDAVYCDPAIMASIGQQYSQAGWLHLVSKHKGDTGLTTDLWVHLDQAAIRDIAVLFVGARQLNFVSLSGSIAPLDLLRLSGHFGIPKMDGGVAVPLPGK